MPVKGAVSQTCRLHHIRNARLMDAFAAKFRDGATHDPLPGFDRVGL
jgi:hypothetical protein